MVRLLLLRHAKAVPVTGGDDRERGLTARGRADAGRLGAFIASEGIAPQAAGHSGARRARETLEIARGKLRGDGPVSVEPRLYEASASAFLDVLRHLSDEARTVLLVGHNPSIAAMAVRLTGRGDPAVLLKMASKFPTAGLAIIDFDADHWREVEEGAGRLVHFATPAELEG